MTEEERQPLGELTQADREYLAPNEPFARALQKLTDEVIPAARQIGILGSLENLHVFEHDSEAMFGRPKERAVEMVRRGFLFIVASRRLFDGPEHAPAAARHLVTWEAGLQTAITEMNVAIGYMNAISDISAEHASRGTAALIAHGSHQVEKVRIAAEAHRGKMPMDAAAVLIAPKVSLSISHTRKLLTKAYPKGTWNVGSLS